MTTTAPDDRISALHSLISQSGLFDAAWYASRLPACERDMDDPIRHFLTEGTQRQLDPGPLFDTACYLKQCWHLRPGTDNALVHYLTYGIEEGRIVEGVHDRQRHNDRQATVPTRLTAFPTPLPRIAVVIHVFYLDVLEHSILPRLRHFGCAHSLLVTTDSEEKAAHIGQLIADALPDAQCFIRVTPNRGRNFGPLLSCWRNALLDHDVFLHLHTKKSLYTGSEQQEWRDTLLDTLLPTQQGVAGILQRFMDDETLGVLQPAPGPAVPWWAWT